MTDLFDVMVALHDPLRSAGIPHAFGGALALGWCTPEARGTQDIDLNLFAPKTDWSEVLALFPREVDVSKHARECLDRDGQARLHWGVIPIDVFFMTTPFHEEAGARTRWEELGGRSLPFLDCHDLAVFKAFFNRSKDWVDLEEMVKADTIDRTRVAAVLIEYLGADDERVSRILHLEAG